VEVDRVRIKQVRPKQQTNIGQREEDLLPFAERNRRCDHFGVEQALRHHVLVRTPVMSEKRRL